MWQAIQLNGIDVQIFALGSIYNLLMHFIFLLISYCYFKTIMSWCC